MTPNRLYNVVPEYTTNDLSFLRGIHYDHLPEVERELYHLTEYNTQVIIKVLEDHSYDGRRIWRLATVWFNEVPVMIIQNAGREGDDFSRRFITNKTEFEKICKYIHNLPHEEYVYYEDDMIGDVIDSDEYSTDLINFYGDTFGSTKGL